MIEQRKEEAIQTRTCSRLLLVLPFSLCTFDLNLKSQVNTLTHTNTIFFCTSFPFTRSYVTTKCQVVLFTNFYANARIQSHIQCTTRNTSHTHTSTQSNQRIFNFYIFHQLTRREKCNFIQM